MSDPDEYHDVSTARPINSKEINLDNPNTNTSTISTDKHRYCSQKSNDNSI